MGMFDDITFRYRMPDGYDGTNYQSKDLHCGCDEYEISPQGRLIRKYSSGYPDDTQLPLGDIEHDGFLNIYTDEDFGSSRKWHEYDLFFRAGSLVTIKCHTTGIELVFEPEIAKEPTMTTMMPRITADAARFLPEFAEGKTAAEVGTCITENPYQISKIVPTLSGKDWREHYESRFDAWMFGHRSVSK